VTVGYMPSWDTSVFDPERRRSSLPAGDGNGRRALPVSRKLPPLSPCERRLKGGRWPADGPYPERE
jgi:hypothetical protein